MTSTYLLDRTGRARVVARVYTDPPKRGRWTCAAGFHAAETAVDVIDLIETPDGYIAPLDPAEARGQWPTVCDECGIDLDGPVRLVVQRELWRAPDGRVATLEEFGPGAMWDAWWLPWKGPDGLSLAVKCPDGTEWQIDGRARNCGSPTDTVHRCWVRHGTPPGVTVDKNGVTCSAGGGSIQTPTYHGFLRNGRFVPA